MIVNRMPDADYRAIKKMNWNSLRLCKKSPLHVQGALDGKIKIDSKSMKFGRAFHTLILEGEDALLEQWSVLDKPDQKETSKPGCLTQMEFRRLRRMRDNLALEEGIWDIIVDARKAGNTELSIFWDDLKTQIPCKARLDLFHDNEMIDLKTTADPSKTDTDIFRRRYHGQMAFYKTGLETLDQKVNSVTIISIESCLPHSIVVRTLSDWSLDCGTNLFESYLEKYQHESRNGFQITDTGTIDPPAWATTDWDQGPQEEDDEEDSPFSIEDYL